VSRCEFAAPFPKAQVMTSARLPASPVFYITFNIANWQNTRALDGRKCVSSKSVRGSVMKAIVGAGVAIFASLFAVGVAAAQPANMGCSSDNPANAPQTLRCGGGVTIVAENGARFTLQDIDGNGRVDSVELSSKALLLEVPKKPSGNRFQVMTPQAIAAVRGTKWAVDGADGKTSVFVVNGKVSVARRTGTDRVVLGPGEGVDVEATGALTVKRWPPARVAALMARLAQ
jgi:ferric-dicitrate binding protein FerR (iron transport regulator)